MIKTKRFVESFFDLWSEEMAYILGLFSADGSMYRNRRGSSYISFTTTDFEPIDKVKSILQISNKIEVYKPKGNSRLSFTLQIGSIYVFNKLIKLGLTPAKSKTLKLPRIPSNYSIILSGATLTETEECILEPLKENNEKAISIIYK